MYPSSTLGKDPPYLLFHDNPLKQPRGAQRYWQPQGCGQRRKIMSVRTCCESKVQRKEKANERKREQGPGKRTRSESLKREMGK